VCVDYHILAIGELDFIENAMFCSVIIGTFFKWDHQEFRVNLPYFCLNLHPKAMEITDAGRSLRLSFHNWNQENIRKQDVIMVLSFLVSPLLNLDYLTMIVLGLIHLYTQYSLS